ncbi:MAG: hypothetical protein AAFO68_06445 [Pseudomonadota bacterium]
MDLSNEALRIGYAIVFALAGALLWYIISGKRRAKTKDVKKAYNWQPETDYDVVQTGEGPMTPAWPQLKAKPGKNAKDSKVSNDGNPQDRNGS